MATRRIQEGYVVVPAMDTANTKGCGQRSTAPATRGCGECTACCSGVLRLQVGEQIIDRGRPCRFRRVDGCGIYDARPKDCQAFQCGWLEIGSPLPEVMRPDRCEAILLINRLQWRGCPVDMAVATDIRIPRQTLAWFIEHSLRSRRPLVYQMDDEWECIGPREFGEQIRSELARGKQLW